jgi:hypothetical protein
MEVVLDYWDRVSYTSCESEIKHQKTITATSDIDVFEQFYKLNNSLRYCNGSFYRFHNNEWANKYQEWLHSEDYKQKSFNLYYGNGVVD